MKILFKYTSRSRPDNFFRGLNSIVNNLSNKEDYHVLCTFDADDNQYLDEDFINKVNSYENISYYFGISTSKIYAINRDIPLAPKWDILVNMSDDFIFTQWGFDDLIRAAFQQNFPDLNGWIHYFDGNQNRISTMSIIGYKYFEISNYIYHPSYITEWADNEEQEKAKIRGKYKYMGDDLKIIIHINPYFGHQGTMDEIYIKNAVYSNADKDNYFKRLALNFEL